MIARAKFSVLQPTHPVYNLPIGWPARQGHGTPMTEWAQQGAEGADDPAGRHPSGLLPGTLGACSKAVKILSTDSRESTNDPLEAGRTSPLCVKGWTDLCRACQLSLEGSAPLAGELLAGMASPSPR
jgi:hypothetical protein